MPVKRYCIWHILLLHCIFVVSYAETPLIYQLQVGDRVGIMRKSDNTLHFFINGVDVGKRVKTIPSVLDGVVDLFGQAEEVTITGMYNYTTLQSRTCLVLQISIYKLMN